MMGLLKTKEVARLLSVAPRTVRLWAECGELSGVKAGRQWRFQSDKLNEFLRCPQWTALAADRAPKKMEGLARRAPLIKGGPANTLLAITAGRDSPDFVDSAGRIPIWNNAQRLARHPWSLRPLSWRSAS